MTDSKTPNSDLSTLRSLVEAHATVQQLSEEIARQCKVRQNEVALLKLERGILRFVFPPELASAGSIPKTSRTAIAAHTATNKQAEVYNSFAQVKHATIFESVPLSASQDSDSGERPPIQKLMSCPIFGSNDQVVGVIQISRKAFDEAHAGPDFSDSDLSLLKEISSLLSAAI